MNSSDRNGLTVALLSVLVLTSSLAAQRTARITGDRLSGFVLPVEPLDGEIRLEALRGWSWTVDDTKRLVLEGDVRVTIGGRLLQSSTAVFWINRIPSADGLINQLAVYFDEASNPQRRAGMGAEGRNLLVTASARGEVTLVVSSLEPRQPRSSATLRRGEQRMARHLRQLVALPPPLEVEPVVDVPPAPDEFFPVPGGTVRPRDVRLPQQVELPDPPRATLPLLPPSGVIRWSAGSLEFTAGETENVILVTGSVLVEYIALDQTEDYSKLTLSAERGVIFTEPGTVEELVGRELDADQVLGIYLEGAVWISVDDGDYVARAPRVYYDLRTQQALMVDAVLRTYVRDSRLPIYARAEELRQVALNQWQARRVRVSTSEFFEPHLALGAERLTITRRPTAADPQERETFMVGEDNTLRVGGTPILGWPRFAGTVSDVPLRSVSLGGEDQDGVQIRTAWDLYALMGTEAPDGLDAELTVEGFTRRGAGVGLDFRYDLADAFGNVDLYGMYDNGRDDRTSSGEDVDRDSGIRGLALWEQTQRLSRDWLLQLQTSWISDETFISARREDDFVSRREYETSAYVRYQKGNSALDLLTQYSLNDFISNDYLLASRAFVVDKLPELTYRTYGNPIFGGDVSYSGETRLTRMKMAFEEGTPNELGVPGRAFGIPPDVPVADSLRARGLTEQWVSRFDTRHEVMIPGEIGALQVTPFAVGRFTAYTDDFEEFSSDADDVRLYGSVGIRLNTEFHTIDNAASNRIFDINRIRHVLEPSVTLWYAYSGDIEDGDLPPYDPEVESLATGAAVRFGLRSTWQTQRGGPGRWRSVDFLMFDANVILNSSDANRQSPTPQFFDYRPEYSQPGDHFKGVLVWLLSDNVSIVTDQTYDFDESLLARGSVGAELRHTPNLRSFIEYRYIDASDNRLLGVGWEYKLTPKYRVSLRPDWDFEENDFRSVSVRVVRSFPDFDLTVQVKQDEIRDETSIGASIDLVEF
ncbi:MAG: LPS assembly protein LptD [Planctomycetota bacterium]|jgi:hypothetical protein